MGPTLGYTVLYVKDVGESLAFYEQAFGCTRRFFNDEHGLQYGELSTGEARLAFYNHALVANEYGLAPEAIALGQGIYRFEIALVTDDVGGLYERALKAGAVSVRAPAQKPWGQTVACVRDRDGFLVGLCTPLP
jgi:uncharacterized glyoxalase superfamily protein PhnB